MFRKLIVILFVCFFFSEVVHTQTTTTIYSSGLSTVVRYVNQNNQYSYLYSSLYQIGRKDGSNGNYSGSQEDIYRSRHTFSLSSIPSNATLSSAKLIYFVSPSSSNQFTVTQTSGTQSYGNLWGEIGSSSEIESDITYGNSSRISSTLLSAINSARSNGALYLGALSQNEGSNNTQATVELRLEVTYTVPPAQVNITAQNNFLYGTIKVGVGGTATQQSSPYPFTTTVGTTVNLEAEDQSYDSYWRLWNDTEAPVGPSKWLKYSDGLQTEKSASVSYSFTAVSNDNSATYEAGLRKLCSLTFSNPGRAIYLNGNTYNSSVTSNVVEQNTVSPSAEGYFVVNGIEHAFQNLWKSSASGQNFATVTASQHHTYTAVYRIQAVNPAISFGTTLNMPIVINWTDNPNSNVTQYRIHRREYNNGWSADQIIATVNSGVQTYTDNEYILKPWRQNTWLEYGITAYYTVEGTWSTGGANTQV